MALPVPTPSTAVAGGKILASDWNSAVRDAVLYLLDLQGGSGRRNLLVNGNFDIWQSGTPVAAIGSGGAWTADQWWAKRDSNGTAVVTQKGFGDTPADSFYGARVAVTDGSAAGGVTEFLQPIETQNAVKAAGHSVALKVRMDCTAGFSPADQELGVEVITGTGSDQNINSGWTGLATSLATVQGLTQDAEVYTFSDIPIPADAREIAVRFFWTNVGVAADDGVTIYNVQLSIGAAALFENTPAQQVLAECERHYQTGTNFWGGYASTGVGCGHEYDLLTSMRTAPTLAGVNTQNVAFGTGVVSTVTATTMHAVRTATSTGAGAWAETFTLDARLI